MSHTWQRITRRIAELPGGKGREIAWLAEALNMSQQRVFNWSKRSTVPAASHADIAAALGWTVNQLLGIQEPPTGWPFATISPERMAALDPMQRAMVELAARNELERIEALSGKRHPRAA